MKRFFIAWAAVIRVLVATVFLAAFVALAFAALGVILFLLFTAAVAAMS